MTAMRYQCPQCKTRYPERQECHVAASDLVDRGEPTPEAETQQSAATTAPPQTTQSAYQQPSQVRSQPAAAPQPQVQVVNRTVYVNNQPTRFTHCCGNCGQLTYPGYQCCSDPFVDLLITEDLLQGDVGDAMLLDMMSGSSYGGSGMMNLAGDVLLMDALSDSGADQGADGSSDGGSDTGADFGSDFGSDGGGDSGADYGSDSGSDWGSDSNGGSNGGFDF